MRFLGGGEFCTFSPEYQFASLRWRNYLTAANQAQTDYFPFLFRHWRKVWVSQRRFHNFSILFRR